MKIVALKNSSQTFVNFSNQVLAQGSSPLAYLSDHIEKYVACVKGKVKEGCDVILRPPKKSIGKKTAEASRWQNIPKPILHYIWCGPFASDCQWGQTWLGFSTSLLRKSVRVICHLKTWSRVKKNWNDGPLDHWTIFWTIVWTILWTISGAGRETISSQWEVGCSLSVPREGCEADCCHSGRGGRQTISTQEGLRVVCISKCY